MEGANLLVIGGAGYIGSVTAELLIERGIRVTILDNLSTGHRAAVPEGAGLVVGELEDQRLLQELLTQNSFDAVMHFAAKSIVPESMTQPGRYFANNVSGVIGLLNNLVEHGPQRLVFSSTAAVYGEPETIPIPETSPLRPNSPYGESKAIVERLLPWYEQAHGLRYGVLRYFNAAGASQRFGEDHLPETHLIPLALRVAAGALPHLTVFGDDYPTPDGTAVRDYVHVLDLAEAHLRAVEHVLSEGSVTCNLGSASGYSVRQVVDAVREATGRELPLVIGSRRPGDSPIAVAQTAVAREVLGWRPRFGLEEMAASACRWLRQHPGGYKD